MKKSLILVLFLLLVVSSFGCGTKGSNNADGVGPSDGEPGIEGYIVKKEGSRILVVDSEPQDFSSTGGLKEFYNAIWFSNAPENVEIGEKVQVWFDVVMESYPGQSEAKKVLVLPNVKPEGADLSEAEAIREALTSPQINTNEVTVIKAAKYDAKSDVWDIHLKQGEEEFHVQVDDNHKNTNQTNADKKYLSSDDALLIAKDLERNAVDVKWETEFQENYLIDPDNKEMKPQPIWIVKALFPPGNKTIFYIDAISGEPVVVSEIEASRIGEK